jgi:hypothetical protein
VNSTFDLTQIPAWHHAADARAKAGGGPRHGRIIRHGRDYIGQHRLQRLSIALQLAGAGVAIDFQLNDRLGLCSTTPGSISAMRTESTSKGMPEACTCTTAWVESQPGMASLCLLIPYPLL